MSGTRVSLASYQPAIDRVVSHVLQGHDTALIAARGCGLTTLRSQIAAEIRNCGAEVMLMDVDDFLRAILAAPRRVGKVRHGAEAVDGPANLHQEVGQVLLSAIRPDVSPVVVQIVDHAAKFFPEQLREIHEIRSGAPPGKRPFLWLGPFDARWLSEQHGVRLHSLPRSHVCLPTLARDDALAAYRAIAENHGCRWGDAILFLVLDLCGNDLSLAEGLAEYIHGNWTEKLYDDSVWDRVGDWLVRDPVVALYRDTLGELDEASLAYLSLLRVGGKPPCHRADLLEEPDAALRRMALGGVLVPNLLPGFYQLRNLTVRYLIDERLQPQNQVRPESLFRRATNDRVAQLLQDVEMMLRSIVRSVFMAMTEADVRTMLQAKQGDAELMPSSLNRALLDWSAKQEAAGLRESLNAVLVEHRKQFRQQNSIWSRVERIMHEDADEGAGQTPIQERAVDYLTFAELGDFVVDLFERVLPGPYRFATGQSSAKEQWRDSLSKVRRLRNRVAHHRNIDFQDMEDLAGTVESMRRDLYDHGAWR